MRSTRARFVGVGLLVCVFAIGMATFLNYFKYKSTLGQIVKARLLVVAYGIDNSVERALGVGLSFAEIATLNALIAREKRSDPLITGIDVFDPSGRVLYSTDQARVASAAPAAWLKAATRMQAKDREWLTESEHEAVSGISLKNNFSLTVGYVAIRYSRDELRRNVADMRGRLAVIALTAVLAVTAIVGLLLGIVLRRFERDMEAIRQRLEDRGSSRPVPGELGETIDAVRTAIDEVATDLARANRGGAS